MLQDHKTGFLFLYSIFTNYFQEIQELYERKLKTNILFTIFKRGLYLGDHMITNFLQLLRGLQNKYRPDKVVTLREKEKESKD